MEDFALGLGAIVTAGERAKAFRGMTGKGALGSVSAERPTDGGVAVGAPHEDPSALRHGCWDDLPHLIE